MAKKTKSNPTSSKPKPRSKFRKKLSLRYFFRLLGAIIISLFLGSIGWVVFYKWVDPPFTFLMAKRKIGALWAGKPSKIHYEFVPYSQISDQIKVAVVASEDQKFPTHNGFDLVSIAKAVEHNKHSKRIRGASTISQQTAKNVFLWDGRSFLRKGLEVYFTFLIEQLWGKKRILEVYLNVAEMGIRTFGVESASYRYYGKSARKLTRKEAAALASILPNPIIFSVHRPTRFLLRRQTWIHQQIQALGGTDYIKSLH